MSLPDTRPDRPVRELILAFTSSFAKVQLHAISSRTFNYPVRAREQRIPDKPDARCGMCAARSRVFSERLQGPAAMPGTAYLRAEIVK